MKICILSMQRVGNFGSLLQSYALKVLLESLGHEVHFIDIEERSEDKAVACNNQESYQSEYEGEKSSVFLSKLSKIDKYAFNRIRIKIIEKQQQVYFEMFRSNELGIKNSDNCLHYDYCIIGSDEVFNALSEARWGFTTQLFGSVKQAKNVITYAASCGSTKFEGLNYKMREMIQNSFGRISAFSVRDKNTANFIQKLDIKTFSVNYDPVITRNFENDLNSIDLQISLPKKFCIVYSYYNRIHSIDEIDSIKNFCKKNNLKIISLGAPQKWIRNYYAVTPFELLKIFSLAEMVITDTFHGTIFASKYSKHFATLVRESNRNKLEDLISKLHIDGHLIYSFDELERAYAKGNEIERMNEIQIIAFNDACAYFTKNLKEN